MKRRVIIFIFLAALIFATMEVALKIGGGSFDPLQLTFLRFLFGGIFLLPFGVIERRRFAAQFRNSQQESAQPQQEPTQPQQESAQPQHSQQESAQPQQAHVALHVTGKPNTSKLRPANYLYCLLLGAVCVPVSMLLFQFGVIGSNAATSAVIFSVNPVFTAVFAHFMSKDDKLNAVKIIALFVAVCGIVMMIRPWDIQPGNTPAGALLTIGAAAAFSLYSVLGGRTLKNVGIFTQTSISFILGALLLFIILLVTGRPIFAGISAGIPVLLYVSFVVTGAGYLTYFYAIRYSNATTGAVTFFLKPIIAPFIAVLILSESITWNMYIGILLILVASFIILWEKKR